MISKSLFSGSFLATLLAVSTLSIVPVGSHAAREDCGQVIIEEVITGLAFGSMMRVSGHNCAGLPENGYVCLDPNGEYMSTEESSRLYTHMLTAYRSELPVRLFIENEKFPRACQGGYPIAHDVRTYR